PRGGPPAGTCAREATVSTDTSRTAPATIASAPIKRFRMSSLRSEIELYAQPRQARGQHARRRWPCRVERVVVGQHRGRVQSVDDVDGQGGPGRGEAQNFADPQVQLVETIAEHRVRIDQVYG